MTDVPPTTSEETAARAGLRIFLNYRRDDTSDSAGRLYDALASRFGEERVFMDIDKIDPGVDFVEVVNDAVESCDVLIALIGREWTNATDSRGQRRLDNPDDFVRMEVQAALDRDVRVLPVLVQEADMPNSDELPEPLKKLARRNAIELSHSRWRYDVGRLITALETVAERQAQAQADADRQAAAENAEEERAESERRAAEQAQRDEEAREAERARAAEQAHRDDEARAAAQARAAEQARAAAPPPAIAPQPVASAAQPAMPPATRGGDGRIAGMPRRVALAVLGGAIVIVVAVAVVLASGGGGGGGGGGGSDPGTVTRDFISALAANDGAKACSLMTDSLQQTAASSANASSCEQGAVAGGDANQYKQWKVSRVQVNGDNATAWITSSGQTFQLLLQKQGGSWKLANVGAP